ncbi:MAG: Gfo/Idh/MocA family oxidoreductase [Chloroflexota bacterium]
MKKLALVGCAHIHTPGFVNKINERDDLDVTLVWDHDAERAKLNAEKLGSTAVSDVNAIWQNDEITAVVICSETNLHEELVLAACRARKDMFVEKPLGIGSADSEKMAEAIKQAGVIFQTGYFMRGFPDMLFAKQAIAQGHFGQITRIRLSNCHSGSLGDWFTPEWLWMTDPAVAGVGAFGDLGTHVMDILLWWLDEKPVRGTAVVDTAVAQYGEKCDEYGECILQFSNGILATITAGWVDIADPIKWEIRGTEGYACFVNNQLLFQSKHVEGADGKSPWLTLPEKQPHAFDLFLNQVVGQNQLPLVSAEEASLRSHVFEKLYESAKDTSWVLF